MTPAAALVLLTSQAAALKVCAPRLTPCRLDRALMKMTESFRVVVCSTSRSDTLSARFGRMGTDIHVVPLVFREDRNVW